MAISDRQAAAIRKRKADAAADQRFKDERARLGLVMGQDDQPAADPDLVGWATFTGPVAGDGHQCIKCWPTRPGLDYKPVQRFRLAARRPCSTCGTALETIDTKDGHR